MRQWLPKQDLRGYESYFIIVNVFTFLSLAIQDCTFNQKNRLIGLEKQAYGYHIMGMVPVILEEISFLQQMSYQLPLGASGTKRPKVTGIQA